MKSHKILSMCLIFVVLLTAIIVPASGYAASDVFQIDNKTHDYNDISTLPSEYSYGTVFLTNDSEIILLDGDDFTSTRSDWVVADGMFSAGDKSYGVGDKVTTIAAKAGQKIGVRITNSAVDANGNVCDVIVETTIPELYEKGSNYDALIKNHTGRTMASATDSKDYTRVLMNFTKYRDVDEPIHNGAGLLRMWLYTNGASTHFTMKYVLHDTETAANVAGAVSVLYDIDIYKNTAANQNDLLKGNEFVSIDNRQGNIYYDKNGILSETDNNGSCVYINQDPDAVGKYTVDNLPYGYSSATIIESLDDATYGMFYGGEYCGMGYTFASPYTFDIDKPVLEVSDERVFEDRSFDYLIRQYIPNNYYATKLGFIAGIDVWHSVVISSKLDSHLIVTGTPIVYNDLGENVTKYFDIDMADGMITAKVNSDFLSKSESYARTYSISTPVKFKSGSGKDISYINNIASLSVDDSTPLRSNIVLTGLKYTVDTNAVIDNGVIQVNESAGGNISDDSIVVNHSDACTNTVRFRPDDNYHIVDFVVDNEVISLEDVVCKNGWYQYDIQDMNVDEDIRHDVIVTTELNDATVTVRYVDIENHELSSSDIIDGKVGDEYYIQAKFVDGYTLIETPDNASGRMVDGNIDVIYVYDRKPAKVIVRYVDKNGTDLLDSVTINGKVGDKYLTEVKPIDGYVLTEIPDNDKGNMTENDIIVVYVYDLSGVVLPSAGSMTGIYYLTVILIGLSCVMLACMFYDKKRLKL